MEVNFKEAEEKIKQIEQWAKGVRLDTKKKKGVTRLLNISTGWIVTIALVRRCIQTYTTLAGRVLSLRSSKIRFGFSGGPGVANAVSGSREYC